MNVVSTLLLGLYDVATWHNVKSTLKQHCVHQCWNLQRWTTLNQHRPFQRWFEQRLTTSKQRCHFQRRFSPCWAILKQHCEYDHLKVKIKPWFRNKIIFLRFKEDTGLKIFFILFSILRRICKGRFARPQNS